MGSQIVRCTGCGAAMEVRVRKTPHPGEAPPPPVPSLPEPGVAKLRRRPMVEIAGPRRAVVAPVPTITVDIPVTPEEAEDAEPVAEVSAVRPPTSIDVPWFAEDIERLPEADVDLEQLALDSFEALPPLPLRLDASSATRAVGSTPARPPGPPGSPSLGK
jgi:hypothetical protein